MTQAQRIDALEQRIAELEKRLAAHEDMHEKARLFASALQPATRQPGWETLA